jgi:2-iminobutanoate/2-iminopropanoate deaminase
MANLSDLLASEGASLADVVRTTVYLHDMGDFAAMNAVYAAAFGDHRPARATVAVAALPLGALVEIDAWAWMGG